MERPVTTAVFSYTRTVRSGQIITIEGGGHGMSRWTSPDMQHWKPEMIAWLKDMLGVQ